MILKNSAVVIAGASRGLGRELSCLLSEEGQRIALIARDRNELEGLKIEINQKYNNIVSIHAVDLTNFNKTKDVFDEIEKQHSKISALVNCAATWTGGKAVKELSTENMMDSLQLNFFTAFNSIKAMLDLPKETICKPAAIVNIGATASIRGSKKCAAFAVAKGALRQLSQSLARELWPENIHVAHLIIDGLIKNKRTTSLNPNFDDNRFIEMSSIARNILFILKQEPNCWTFEWDIRPFNESW